MKREEDSGLHDIRNLAQSTKQRLSKRTSQHPIQTDDDVLSSSSASWKNLALPQPAKMVSLPELADLPTKQEVAARDKAAKAAAKDAARTAKAEAKGTEPIPMVSPADLASRASATSIEAVAPAAPVEVKPAFASFAKPKAPSKNRNRNLALVGMGVAAAAGITIFVMTQNNTKSAQPTVAAPAAAPAGNGVSADRMKELDDATAKLKAQHEAALAAEQAPPPPVDTGAVAGAAAPAPVAVAEKQVAKPTATKAPATRGAGKSKADVATTPEVAKTEAAPKKGVPQEGDKDFDALLKEAGVQDKKDAKPHLDKKELTSDDFKTGMNAIETKAKGCFKGTQGSANVKLTIAPSGHVAKVTVSGVFAGKPEADCVSAAVKSASFPAWDGGPQSFGYPILLSE
ncbi:MAG: hypothetical protein ABI678_03835 [Kofleriaceae bacterium]